MTTDCKKFGSIKDMVNYLEKEYNITVLSIRDYGSRAWNLDSETSDMDAGMVFTQDPIKYIELSGYRQNIDRKFMLGGEEFELIGWNIKRFAELLNKSNPSMIEWLNSDLIYYDAYTKTSRIKTGRNQHAHKLEEASTFFNEIKKHANQNFKPIALWGHYREMGKANYNKYLDNRNDLSIKRHLYILRGLTYARYILETHERPPLDFQKFVDEELPELDIPGFVETYLEEFIHRKTNGDGDTEFADKQLWEWIADEIDRGEDINHSKHDVRGIDKQKINDLIKKVIPQ